MNLQAIIFRWWCLLEAIGGTDKSTDAMAMEAIVDLVLAMDEVLQLQEERQVRFRLRTKHLPSIAFHL